MHFKRWLTDERHNQLMGYQIVSKQQPLEARQLLMLAQEGAQQLLSEQQDGRLLLPVSPEQLCDEPLMNQLLDQLLKERFSWRNLVLVIASEPDAVQLERFNQAAYRLHGCQVELWLSVTDFAAPNELLVDALLIDSTALPCPLDPLPKWDEVLFSLEQAHLPLIWVEPPSEALSTCLQDPTYVVLSSLH
ncbi:hypothetical protein ABUE30_16760 [Celerinatantimonas yamalensis]|uniref:Uncharacterized protein n=2 Tax=Celerinatantimonas yamalensis TaxID=559956 RepID=A0ABW9GBE5_9GAMM